MVKLGQKVKFKYDTSIHRRTYKDEEANGVVVAIIPKNKTLFFRVKIVDGSYIDDRDNEITEAVIPSNQIITHGSSKHIKSKKMKKKYRKKTYRKRHKDEITD